ncbi:hypothetical protein GSI_06783 [Ganoderma sinense ZZ0214-1]|uniref:DUF7726 domain-containing protein n=1 Tax=Ganoderma sinense ZZ0214-1 TaxID=1077348 RepID=A0A2G8SER8_9APHY|nr:hypothetical protein GSI_06783 [Ganoderma sinense ZZ0214-1]
MPPKRKSDTFELLDPTADQPGEGPSSGAKKGKKAAELPKKWFEVVLDGEDEGNVPIYDDCNDIRRKIRALQKEPGFKITQWLETIGRINNNSYQRFMKATGPTGGAGNGTYYAAYVYFEKRRIAEGKKKSAKRVRAEEEQGGGLPREDRSRVWVFTAAR